MTLNPAFVGLDLGREYWDSLRTPQYASPGSLITVDSLGDFAYSATSMGGSPALPDYVIPGFYFVGIHGTVTVVTIPLADDTITEIGYQFVHSLTSNLKYVRQGARRYSRVNGGAPVESAYSEAFPEIDLAGGEFVSQLTLSGNDVLVQHIFSWSAEFASEATARIWVKELAV